jgi:hypothetical protein
MITNAIQPVLLLKNMVQQLVVVVVLLVPVVIMNNNSNIVQVVEQLKQLKQLIVVMVNLIMVVKVVTTIQVICIFVVVKDVFAVKPFVYQINRVLYDKFDIECLHQNQIFLNVFIFVVNQMKLLKK